MAGALIASGTTAFGLFAAAHDTVSACDALVVPSIDLERCVVPGGQAQLDAGSAVRMDLLSTDVVHWIAGHRTSHGATFGSLTTIAIGDLVAYRNGVYRVEQHIVVDRFVDTTAYEWIGSNRDALILQTSASGSFVHFWYAPLTSEPFVVAQSPAEPPSTTPPPDTGDAVVDASRTPPGMTSPTRPTFVERSPSTIGRGDAKPAGGRALSAAVRAALRERAR